MTPFNAIENTRVEKLVTGDIAPNHCPRCSAPRWMIDAATVSFKCHTRVQFFRVLPGEKRNPKIKQTLKCLAFVKAGGWKRAAA